MWKIKYLSLDPDKYIFLGNIELFLSEQQQKTKAENVTKIQICQLNLH